METIKCQGWRRRGGMFSFGPPVWARCENRATVNITVTQDGKTEIMHACMRCWGEALENDAMVIRAVAPIRRPINSDDCV